MDYTALKNEIVNDPLSLGYSTPYSAGRDNAVADLLNQVRATILLDREVIPAYEVIEATVPAEWAALSAAEKQRYETITGAGEVDVKGTNTRAAFAAMFSAGTATRSNLSALQQRQGSRAEQLFGTGVAISAQDVAIARGS
jgi:hypothetical protein